MFPLGEMNKAEVRSLAHAMGLAVAAKGDSQEICFVPNGHYAAFLEAYLRSKSAEPAASHGELVMADGLVIGEHTGVHHFTVGQRRGLGVATGEALYVIATDAATQRVTVGPNAKLFCAKLVAREVNWVSWAGLTASIRTAVKIRNKHEAAAATLYPASQPDRVEVRFDVPQRAVTPGQAAVFYDGDLVLGGGWIE